jgi:hypothetical protein
MTAKIGLYDTPAAATFNPPRANLEFAGYPAHLEKAEIAHYLAAKKAEGIDVPQNWTKALDLLRRRPRW